MGAKTVGQIRTAMGTKLGVVAEDCLEQLTLAQASSARHAFRNSVTCAVAAEELAFFASQPAGPSTVEVDEIGTVKLDCIVRR
jgi:hypothetical protein